MGVRGHSDSTLCCLVNHFLFFLIIILFFASCRPSIPLRDNAIVDTTGTDNQPCVSTK